MPTYQIVGAKHRPPAIAILSCLPADCPLFLIPEPDNAYDPNAIQVVVLSEDIPSDQHPFLKDALAGYGFELEDVLDFTSLHLGYVPREFAADLAPQFQGHSQMGKLTFSSKGVALVLLGEIVIPEDDELEEIGEPEEEDEDQP